MRCSVASLERAEPMIGTAPVAKRWLMIEVAKAWEPQPLDTPTFDGPIRDVIAAAVEVSHAQLCLVRRPGRSVEKDHGRWWAVDTTSRRQVSGQWTRPADLHLAAEALGEPLSTSTEPVEEVILVCTHGTRDVCCAIDGRQLARSLSAAHPDQVWESSHLGGHRFAPTFALLPDGAVYGRVRGDEALAVVAAHRAGRVRASHLRGISRFSPPEQAAIVAALEKYGPVALGDVRLLGTEVVGDHEWVVRLCGDEPIPDAVAVTVRGTVQPPQPLSCGPAKPKVSTTYAVTGFVEEDA